MNNTLDFIFDEDGQGLVDYGLLLILVAVIVFAGLQIFGKRIETFYNFDIPNSNNSTP